MPPTPASEHQLCQFVAILANDKLCHATIKCYLSAVRHLHLENNCLDPNITNMGRLEQVLRGVKYIQARGSKPRTRLPISVDILYALKQSWEKEASDRDCVMLWAAAALCFFGFLRSGEITVPDDKSYDPGAHLSFHDVSVDSITKPELLKVRIKASKTDPFRLGVDIFVGRTHSAICPVTAVLAYLAVRGPKPGPLFQFTSGLPLTRARFGNGVRKALSQAGINCSGYSGHSFRSGAATTAAEQGISDAMIKMLGRWKSSAYQLYIQTPRSQLAGVSRRLVRKS